MHFHIFSKGVDEGAVFEAVGNARAGGQADLICSEIRASRNRCGVVKDVDIDEMSDGNFCLQWQHS